MRALLLLLLAGAAYGEPISEGQQIYNANCVACHQASGAGVRGAFPPVAGAPILKDKAGLIRVTLFGRPGTAMPSSCHLHAEEIAAVLTYIRGAWGAPAQEPVAAQEVLAVLAASPDRKCQTAESSRAPLPRQLWSYDLNWLTQPELQAALRGDPQRALLAGSGRIVRAGDGKLYLISMSDPLDPSASLPPSVRNLAPCAVSHYAASQRFAAWTATPARSPDRRFQSAHELSFARETGIAERIGTFLEGKHHYSTDAMRRTCGAILNAKYSW